MPKCKDCIHFDQNEYKAHGDWWGHCSCPVPAVVEAMYEFSCETMVINNKRAERDCDCFEPKEQSDAKV